jgi:hypothetical protein
MDVEYINTSSMSGGTTKAGKQCTRKAEWCKQHINQKPAEREKLIVDDSIIDDVIHKLVITGALRDHPEEATKYIRRIRQCTPYKCVLGTERMGRLLMHPGGSNYAFIELVDTPLEGKNMANRMMSLYHDLTKKTAIPHLITQKSVGYWYKHYSRRGFQRFDDLMKHINDEYGLTYDDVCWWHLKSEYLQRELWAGSWF